MKKNTVILATRNKGKAREFAALLEPFGINVASLAEYPDIPDVEETGATFLENALLKATAVSKASGLVAIADDSGIEADALGKAPGVYSARFSATPDTPATDERNLRKLLDEMRGIPTENRTGRFRCCMAAATPDGDTITADGSWEGVILEEPQGENGFGYDPVFYDRVLGMSAAQMSAGQKNSRSHRALATKHLLDIWPAFWRKWSERNS